MVPGYDSNLLPTVSSMPHELGGQFGRLMSGSQQALVEEADSKVDKQFNFSFTAFQKSFAFSGRSHRFERFDKKTRK